MSNYSEKQRAELSKLYEEIGLCDDIDCTEEENERYRQMVAKGEALPKGVYRYKKADSGEYVSVFYVRRENDLTEAERAEFIQLKQYAELRTIRRCMIFFVILAAIPLVSAAFLLIAQLLGGNL